MVNLVWAEHLSVGNALIDSEHRDLIVAVNSIEHAILGGDRVALSKAFDAFESCVCIHLGNEECIAAAVNFPFTQNKLEHQQSMNEIRYMVKKLEAQAGVWPAYLVKMYSRFLNDWMTDHITKNNMRMKPVLQAYPYDFKPDGILRR